MVKSEGIHPTEAFMSDGLFEKVKQAGKALLQRRPGLKQVAAVIVGLPLMANAWGCVFHDGGMPAPNPHNVYRYDRDLYWHHHQETEWERYHRLERERHEMQRDDRRDDHRDDRRDDRRYDRHSEKQEHTAPAKQVAQPVTSGPALAQNNPKTPPQHKDVGKPTAPTADLQRDRGGPQGQPGGPQVR